MIMEKKHTCIATNSSKLNHSCHSIPMHKQSHTISKPTPKIRIIHIFAPAIIKTDVKNFRELVQRLTGKPAAEKGCKAKKKGKRVGRDQHCHDTRSNIASEKMEPRNDYGFSGLDEPIRERVIKEEERVWKMNSSENYGGGFLSGFADLEGFVSELGDQFPLLPSDASHTNLHGIGSYSFENSTSISN